MNEKIRALMRPYARACLSARELGPSRGIGSLFLAPLAACISTPAQKEILLKTTRKEQLRLVASLGSLLQQGSSFDASILFPLLQLLARRAYLAYLDVFLTLFSELESESLNVLDAEVTAAKEPDSWTLTEIQRRLETRYAKKINMRLAVDPSLLGGLTIRIKDQLIDASLQGRLRNMTRHLHA